MPEISLPAFHVTATRTFPVEVGHELARDLEHYRAFYRQAYGADVSEPELLREMARRFLESDRDFQVAKYGLKNRSRSRSSSPSPSASQPHSSRHAAVPLSKNPDPGPQP